MILFFENKSLLKVSSVTVFYVEFLGRSTCSYLNEHLSKVPACIFIKFSYIMPEM
jgi:hypothetical protein